VVPMEDPKGRPVYWFSIRALEPPEEGTDRWAVERGWISLTPLRLDLTDEKRLAEILVRPAAGPESLVRS
jgi:5'-nucleotidase